MIIKNSTIKSKNIHLEVITIYNELSISFDMVSPILSVLVGLFGVNDS